MYEVGKAATSATTLIASDLTRYIWATWKATIRYIIVIVYWGRRKRKLQQKTPRGGGGVSRLH
jgi:hypothetical protein